tara:strand:+ start:557 stop:757 length:201 start_codon:yes stop_codon:yes gene_type:complete
MQIKINGNTETIEESISLANLLDKIHQSNSKIAVEINGNLIIRSDYDNCFIKENDQIEIVHAIGGG